jgi:hypothetical protein
MPGYKKQHYLPTAYLKNFSSDETKRSRSGNVWRLEGKSMRSVPIVSQCSSDYHYSKNRAEEIEKGFQKSEQAYTKCVDLILKDRPATRIDYGNLLIAMFDFYLRNRGHENWTGEEEYDAYRARQWGFINELLTQQKGGNVDEDGLIKFIETNWRLRILSPPEGCSFFTSDHPSVWLSLNSVTPALHMVFLPVSPTTMAVSFDSRVFEAVGDRISVEDLVTFNVGQIHSYHQCIFSATAFTEAQIADINHFRTQIRYAPSDLTQKGGRFNLWHLEKQYLFSFLRFKSELQ